MSVSKAGIYSEIMTIPQGLW